MTATRAAASTIAETTATPTDDLVVEVTAWLEANWDPDLTVAEWWDRLGRSGWAVPTWPEEWYGKGLSRAAARPGREKRAIAALSQASPRATAQRARNPSRKA